MKISVIGAGAWGTAIAAAAAPRHDVLLWARNPAQASAVPQAPAPRIVMFMLARCRPAL